MKGKIFGIIIVSLMLTVSSIFAMGTTAQDNKGSSLVDTWPDANEIQIIVPFPAGGTADVICRLIANKATPYFNVPIVVFNKPGAGGAVAASGYLSEKANTNKLIYVTRALMTAVPIVSEVPFTSADFDPVIGVELAEFILYVNPSESGIDSLESLKEFAKTKKILYSVGGPVADNALIQKELFKQMGIKAEMVVYNGAIEAVNNLASGNVHVTVAPPAQAQNFVKQGKLVPLAVFNDIPYTGFEGFEVSPITEYGYDIVFPALLYLAIRKGTDPDLINSIYDIFNVIYQDTDYNEKLDNMMVKKSTMGPSEIQKYIDRQNILVKKYLE